jgi:hypothetical protein
VLGDHEPFGLQVVEHGKALLFELGRRDLPHGHKIRLDT